MRVAAGFQPLPAELVSLETALGRVLAQDVAARTTHPPADVSAMDGYAVRASDVKVVPASLSVVGEAAAGGSFDNVVSINQAVRIFTGAPVPAGADTIVIQEHTRRTDNEVIVSGASPVGRYIRRRGSDFSEGDILLPAGRKLTARDIGLAAAMNVPWLAVRRRPRVAVLATGNELVMPGEPLQAAQIVSSGNFAAAALLRDFGAEPSALGIARDEPAALDLALAAAQGADLLVTIGGASVGDFDLVRQAFEVSGFEHGFYKVAMRPGKPLIFGRLGKLPVLGLPGNPVSAVITMLVFVKPAIDVMLGLPPLASDPVITALLGADLPANDERQDYLRATLSRNDVGDLEARPFAVQDSSMLRLLADADCLIIRPPWARPAVAGDRVAIMPLSAELHAG